MTALFLKQLKIHWRLSHSSFGMSFHSTGLVHELIVCSDGNGANYSLRFSFAL